MELYLLRHGIAVDRDALGYEQDSKRPLTTEGREKMQGAARGMLAQGCAFDLILTSPYVRAKKTADIVAKVFMAEKKTKTTENLSVGADPRKLIAELIERDCSVKSVLLVGHEPFLSDLASVLLSGNQVVAMTLKKGSLCKLQVQGLHYGKCATLEWLLTPRQLRKLG